MNPSDLAELAEYVNENIDNFHSRRLIALKGLQLSNLLKKNPYLFRAKNISTATELIEGTIAAFLSSSEEKDFGDFFEGLAIFIARRTSRGRESSTSGADLDIVKDGVHYVIAIKSGPAWGNSSQHAQLGRDLTNAMTRLRQKVGVNPDMVLGICYGKVKTARNKDYGYLKLVGQNFWTFISGDKDLFTDIIEPLGYRAKEHNEAYNQELANVKNRLTKQFLDKYCNPDGSIDWKRVVQANSGNYDLNTLGLDGEPEPLERKKKAPAKKSKKKA